MEFVCSLGSLDAGPLLDLVFTVLMSITS